MIKDYGYPLEVHETRTHDGYDLTLHRIIGPNKDSLHSNKINTNKDKAVLLLHGFASSSADFVIGGPDNALGNGRLVQ